MPRPTTSRRLRQFKEGFASYMNDARAFPLHADAKAWFKAEKIGFKDADFGLMKKGELVLEKNILGILRMLLSAPPKTRDARGRQMLIDYVKANDSATVRIKYTAADCADVVCEPGLDEYDSLNGGAMALVEVLRKNVIQKLLAIRGIKKCRDPDAVLAAIDWMHVDEGRQISDNPSLSIEAATRLSTEVWKTPVDVARQCAIAWEKQKPETLLLGTNYRGTPTGMSIILPVTEVVYAKVRAGKISPHDIKPTDLRESSTYLIFYAAGRRPHEFGGDRRGGNLGILLCSLAQMGIFSLSGRVVHEEPLHLLSFAASIVAETRLRSTYFKPLTTYVPGTNIRMMERILDGTDAFDLDALYRGVFGLFRRHVDLSKITAWSPPIGTD